ncbi:hybrid sensor histidine kinase/response regulator transcription factor [Ahniella affigens]|uniref:hybrid sensor histidine kinase/response regulator transcription factor n=1 Tax=Ahniella affigens TaxID=2021234 RepID=UPI001474EC69|nr:ATP-binding protein [Ahniella affigens]
MSKSLSRLPFLVLAGMAAAAFRPVLAAPLADLPLPMPMQTWLPAPGREHPQNWAVDARDDGSVLIATSNSVLVFDGVYWQKLMPSGVDKWVWDVDSDGDRFVAGTIDDFGWYGKGPDGNYTFHSLSQAAGQDGFGMIGRSKISPDGMFFATREHVFWQPPDGSLQVFDHRHIGNMYRLGQTVLIQETSGIQRFDGARRVFVDDHRFDLLIGTPIVGMVETGPDQGWVATLDRGLWRLEGPRLAHWPSAADSLGTALKTTAVLPLPDGRIVLGTRLGGLLVLNSDGTLAQRVDTADGLPGNRITGFDLDRQQGLWVTMEGGIARLDLGSGITRFGRAQGVSTIMEAVHRHQGQLYAAGSEGVYRLTPEPERAARFVRVDGPANGVSLLSHAESGSLLIGADNALWALFDGASSATQLFASRRINQLVQDQTQPNHVYAFSTRGLQRYRWDDGAWQSDGDLPNFDIGLARGTQAADGSLWIGSNDGDLVRVRPAADWSLSQIERWDGSAGVQKGWNHVFRVGDRLLVGTGDMAQDLQGPPLQLTLLSSQINLRRMAVDSEPGRLWSPSGMLSLQRNTFTADPTLSYLLDGPSWNDALIDGDHLWIAANEGVFRVPRAPFRRPTLAVRFAGVVLGRPSPGEQANALAYPNRLDLPMALDEMRLKFAVPDYSLGTPVQYRDRLLPGSGEWSAWRPEAFKDFTQLPYGESVFEVEATDHAGLTATPLRITLYRPAPWYLTLWAKAFYALAALGMLLFAASLGRRWRVQALELRARELGAQVAERTETIRQQRDELAEQSAARTRFFANVSHEFRTPLTLMIGPLQALRERARANHDPDSAKLADTALKNSAQMQHLVDEVLDLHRLEAGQIKLHKQTIDLATFTRQLGEDFAELARLRGIALQIHAETESLLPVSVDVVQLRRILSNLIGNALKFSGSGSLVGVYLGTDNGYARVLIEDQGPGIPAEDVPQVFERYFQSAHHQKMARGGTGIGLALVRELVELHGGQVGIDSTLGVGTKVWFLLPLAAADASLEALPLPEAGHGSHHLPAAMERTVQQALSSGKTVLVVDDNEELRAFLKSQLAPNYRVIDAGNGADALTISRAETPDLIVTDLMMPVMDGHEFVAALRADPEIAFIPVLMLSARGQKRDIVSGLTIGADDYLPKPFDTSELIARIAALLAAQQRLARRLSEPPRAMVAAEAATASAGTRKRATFSERLDQVLLSSLGDTKLSVETLADKLHMDRSTLFRKCQESLGTAPADYLRQVRLRRAHELLSQNQGSVSEVAYAVGFESLSHFSRSFKAEFGVPPSQIGRSGSGIGAH